MQSVKPSQKSITTTLECINCTNISVNTSEIALEEVATTNSMGDEETDELMDWIFGSGQVEFNSEEDMLF